MRELCDRRTDDTESMATDLKGSEEEMQVNRAQTIQSMVD